MSKKIVVISGVNLIDGGPLSIYTDFLDAIIENHFHEKFNVIALVGQNKLFKKYESKIALREFPKSKKSWFNRLYYEYIYFSKISKKIRPDIWISMHDMTPNVKAKKRYVYCHNSSMFGKMSLKEIKYGWKYYFFSKMYKFLYAINIHQNSAVIVQQDWMRKEFIKIYKLDEKQVIVARPSLPQMLEVDDRRDKSRKVFVYPSFPRYFKNFQVVCKAAENLEKKGITDFKIYITLNGSENTYSKELVEKYKNCKSICFCGLLTRENLYELYGQADCLLFMSKLETWGIPITEFKLTGKSIIVSDLPYAHETIGTYEGVAFVDPDDDEMLCNKMLEVIHDGKIDSNSYLGNIISPYAKNWNELLDMLLLG